MTKRFVLSRFLLYLLAAAVGTKAFGNNSHLEKQVIAQLSAVSRSSNNADHVKKQLAKLPLAEANVVTSVFKANELAKDKDALNVPSTNLFKKALREVEQLNRLDLKLWVSCQYAFYLYRYRKYEESFPVFVQTIGILDRIDEALIINPAETFKKTGFFLMTMGDDEKAVSFLLKAQRLADTNSLELPAIVNNLGSLSLKKEKLVEAEAYFQETLRLALKTHDKLRYAKALGSLAEIKLKQNDYTGAISLLQQDVNISKQVGDNQNTIFALVNLGEIYLAQGEIHKANALLKEAEVYATQKTYLKSSGYEINRLILEIAKKTGNEKEELNARRNLESLEKTLAQLDGQAVIAKVGWKMQKRTLQLTIETERAKREKETLAKILAIVTCCLLLLVIVLVVKRYRTKIKVEKDGYEEKIASLSRDKEISERKLMASEQTMHSYQTYLKEKTAQIAYLDREIRKIRQATTVGSEKYVDQMEELLKSHLLNRNTWLSFKKTFVENYPVYYQHLCENFKDLSDANLRIIFLQKLEMNNVEIARILGLTLDAIKKAKQRLRRKYQENYNALFEHQML